MRAQQLLDAAYSRAKLAELDADQYAQLLAEELPGGGAAVMSDFETCDAQLGAALAACDAVAARAMRVLLDQADTPLAAPTRNVFATTVVAYAADLGLLEQRAHAAAQRGGGDPARVAAAVVDVAREALRLREQLSGAVFALAAERARAAIAVADGAARDRRLPEPVRKRWSALRRELEAIAAQPARIAAAPLAARLAAHEEQLDEPDPVAEPTFASMIELD